MADKLYKDEEWLREQYWEQRKSTKEMAEIAKCTCVTIRNWMNRFDIPRRTHAELVKDPIWQEKVIRGVRRRTKDPEWQRRNAEAARRRARDPEWRKAASETLSRLHQDPEFQKRIVEGNRKKAKDPEWLKKTTEAAQCRAKDPKWLKKMTEIARKRAQDPEWQKQHAEMIRCRSQNPEWQHNHTEAMRRLAKDPEWRKKNTRATRETNRRLALKKRRAGKKTNIESVCYDAFECLDLEFTFEKPIKGGYIADFFFPSHNVIVEALGEYWHRLPGRRKKDSERKESLEACGYIVLEWWGNDIKADVWKLINDELLPLLKQPSRMARPPNGVIKPIRGKDGWESVTQLALTL